MSPRVGLHVLEKREISRFNRDSNTGPSSPWPSLYTDYVLLSPRTRTRELCQNYKQQGNSDKIRHLNRAILCSRLRLKCDGTRTETRFCLSAKRMSPFKSAVASVQSTTGSRGVRISGSNAGYSMFRGSEGYWLPTPFASFPFTSPPGRHRVPSGFNWTLISTEPPLPESVSHNVHVNYHSPQDYCN